MPAAKEYDEETGARAIRMYRDNMRDHPGISKLDPRKHISALLDINQPRCATESIVRTSRRASGPR
jgi:hypothetical protein